MTNVLRNRLIGDIEKDPTLSKITEETGVLRWTKPGVATENDLADLIYRISKQYDLSLIEAKNAVKETYQSENGEAKIRSGIIDVSQYTGASSEQPEPSEESVFSEADAILEGVGLSETTPDPNFRMTGVQDAPAQDSQVASIPNIESVINNNKDSNVSDAEIARRVSSMLEPYQTELQRKNIQLKNNRAIGNAQKVAELEREMAGIQASLDYYQNPLELIASR